MNLQELKERLEEVNAPKNMYSLDGGLRDDTCCIEKKSGLRWEVYYTERGQKSYIRFFNSEEEACNYFYKWFIDGLGENWTK